MSIGNESSTAFHTINADSIEHDQHGENELNLNMQQPSTGEREQNANGSIPTTQPHNGSSEGTQPNVGTPDDVFVSRKKQFKLQQLEEQLRLKEEFLREKYRILQASDSDDDVGRQHQAKGTASNLGSGKSIILEQPLASQPTAIENAASHSTTAIENTALRNFAAAYSVPQSTAYIEGTAPRNFAVAFDAPQSMVSCYSEAPRTSAATFAAPQLAADIESTIPRNFSNTFAASGHQSTPININHLANTRNDTNNISAAQLAARQSVPKDLPPFNGDPREWPIFISAFEQSTQMAGYSNHENLIRLQKCLHGKARDVVRNCLMLPEMVPDIISTLKMYFGRPEYILRTLIEKARMMPAPKGKLEALIDFAFVVKNVCATIKASQLTAYLNNPTLMEEFVKKLGPDLMLNWALHSKNITIPNLQDFSEWLYIMAEAASRVTTPVLAMTEERKLSRRDVHLNTHQEATGFSKTMKACAFCNDDHRLSQCEKFNNLSIAARWNVVKTQKLCRQCLGRHQRRCWNSKPCGVNGCVIKHHMLLHNTALTHGAANSHQSSSIQDSSYFRILPVKLYGTSKVLSTFAFMDDGSTLTLIDESLANELNETGTSQPLCIHWTGDVRRYEEDSRKINLKISATASNSPVFTLQNVHTIKNLGMTGQTMIAEQIKQQLSYLRDIPLPTYTGAIPKVIIGVNNANLIASLKVREGGWNQPIATKTRLGWALFGGTISNVRGSLNIHKCCCKGDDAIHDMIKNYMSDENSGIMAPNVQPMSKEDERALQILDSTCELKENRYSVGLLWKDVTPKLPDSLSTALRRMQCLRRKIEKDSQLAQNLRQQIRNLVEKGYATELPEDAIRQSGGNVWYLPIFLVRNPNKPNKVRLVWDAAAKTSGYSLNNYLMKGPDLLIPLIQILFNFRIGSIAICGDISEMFHRILVRPADTDAQRFLWWDETKGSVVTFKLNVLSFGASCSPCIAHYVRDRNAARHLNTEPKGAYAISHHHYVDDYIDSTQTVEEAIAVAKSVRRIHANGGFHMTNWSSNSQAVLDALEENIQTSSKTFECSENPTQYEKILGLYWKPETDQFSYILKFVRLRRNVFDDKIKPTKRELLQVLMSVYDPLGLVTCVLSYLKIIMQEIWRSGITWDEPLTNELQEKWKNWCSYLPTITSVAVPRCYSPHLYQVGCSVQLHTFVDASENAYAAVSYFRIKFGNTITVKIVAAKSKVAPLRPLTIPRLELQAAVIGVRLMKTICNSHQLKLEKKIVWTDSKTVLKWLQNDPRQFQQFVMFRIAEIHAESDLSQWRWVPSKSNVADIATKTKPNFEIEQKWFNGPSFLYEDEDQWPTAVNLGQINTCETRVRFLHLRKSHLIQVNFEYFSTWVKLYRAIGNWIVFVDRLKNKSSSTAIKLSSHHIMRAKTFIYKTVQMMAFNDEWTALQLKRPVCNSSPLSKMIIYLDGDEVIRVKNRASNLPLMHNTLQDFIVLPPQHYVTSLIISHFHQRYHHINHETALNEVRQIYFVPKLRTMFKSTRRNCQYCKINNAQPQAPQMAPLPRARLGVFCRPFTYIGVDYFGPITIIEGRKNKKRWGVLITCLTMRAIHIEIVHSLSTDSCLMSLRNFIARRGTPKEIYSDNGTNFRGADNFLKDELKLINHSIIQKELALEGIVWHFNPPAAPHMGGAWERLVRSIKSILNKITPSQKFTDESLRSALMEVEMTVNSRPLTFVSLDSADQEAITPNHFLLGSSNGAKPFCDPEHINIKLCLRQSEIFANMFWRRWIKEMLPTFTRRGKWFEKVKPISEGDIVLIVDENQSRNVWLKGKVVEAIKAKDGQVRRARVKTINGIMERPAVKLAVLDVGTGERKLSEVDRLPGGELLQTIENLP